MLLQRTVLYCDIIRSKPQGHSYCECFHYIHACIAQQLLDSDLWFLVWIWCKPPPRMDVGGSQFKTREHTLDLTSGFFSAFGATSEEGNLKHVNIYVSVPNANGMETFRSTCLEDIAGSNRYQMSTIYASRISQGRADNKSPRFMPRGSRRVEQISNVHDK